MAVKWSRLGKYFTYEFCHHHLATWGPGQSYRDAEKGTKKKAHAQYQTRTVPRNTVVCLWQKDLTRLISEVERRQGEYRANPHGLFVSEGAYTYCEREGKHAKSYGPARLQYGVIGESGFYKISHLEGMVRR